MTWVKNIIENIASFIYHKYFFKHFLELQIFVSLKFWSKYIRDSYINWKREILYVFRHAWYDQQSKMLHVFIFTSFYIHKTKLFCSWYFLPLRNFETKYIRFSPFMGRCVSACNSVGALTQELIHRCLCNFNFSCTSA